MSRPPHPDLAVHFTSADPFTAHSYGDRSALWLAACHYPEDAAATDRNLGLTHLAFDTLSFVSGFDRGES
jgi:hypothetical protein